MRKALVVGVDRRVGIIPFPYRGQSKIAYIPKRLSPVQVEVFWVYCAFGDLSRFC